MSKCVVFYISWFSAFDVLISQQTNRGFTTKDTHLIGAMFVGYDFGMGGMDMWGDAR